MSLPDSLIRLLAVSGSLRAVSSNTTLLQSAMPVAPDGVTIGLYEGIGSLPHFNPDEEDTDFPAVRDWRTQRSEADGVLISSPEYAHGVPGSLKNALDWVVGSEEFIGKPVAHLNATPPAAFAQKSLKETLTAMSAHVIPEDSLSLSLRGKSRDAIGVAAHTEMASAVRKALATMVDAILAGHACTGEAPRRHLLL